jgi:hypothetical protein
MKIKKWISDQYPNLGFHCIASRDILYLTNVKNRDEQYTYPLANILSIEYAFAYDCLTADERIEADVAPMDLILIIITVRKDKQLFIARNMELTFDYYGFDNEEV